jgi:hypothetical protein
MSEHVAAGPSFRSSTNVQLVQQRDGRFEIVVIQANIIPVSAADAGNSKLVAEMAMGTVNQYEISMSIAELVETLRYAADQIENTGRG